ncbi:324_t:CDS:1, partial [Rhizophagus irregularis]
ENDIHTQTPITENLTFMDEDPIETNTDKGKAPDTQTATQTNTPNPLQITVLTDIFKQTPQDS